MNKECKWMNRGKRILKWLWNFLYFNLNFIMSFVIYLYHHLILQYWLLLWFKNKGVYIATTSLQLIWYFILFCFMCDVHVHIQVYIKARVSIFLHTFLFTKTVSLPKPGPLNYGHIWDSLFPPFNCG